MPSGHVPAHALRHPEQFAGLNCLIPVPIEAVQELRKILEEDIGSYEENMSWFSEDFNQLAENVSAELSHPTVTLDNACTIGPGGWEKATPDSIKNRCNISQFLVDFPPICGD